MLVNRLDGMLRGVGALALVAGLGGAAFAGWTIRESDVKGSNLEQMVKEGSPLVHVVDDAAWERSNFASAEDVAWFREARYGMFICYGLSTFVNRDLSWGVMDGAFPDHHSRGAYPRETWTSWPSKMRLEAFSREGLARILKASGMRYVVVVAKHHDGFHLWDTALSDFKVTNTPYGKDFIREVVEACRLAGVKVGIYYSQRDWYHPDYCPIDPETADPMPRPPRWRAKPGKTPRPGARHARYVDYQFKAVEELCTKYGKIDIFWFDSVWNGGMFTPEMWDAERLTRRVRELQPHILINNRASLPGDFDTPEQRIGMFQNRRPWESCMTLASGWSYTGPKSRPKTPVDIFRKLQSTAIGDGNLLLSWGPRWDGSWAEDQTAVLLRVGEWLKQYGESIYGTRGGPFLPGAWGGATFRGNHVWLHVVRVPKEGKLTLPRLPGITFVRQEMLSGEGAIFRETPEGYVLDLSGLKRSDQPIILKLTANRELTLKDVQGARQEAPARVAIATGAVGQTLSWEGLRTVTAVRVRSKASATFTVETSADGETWHAQAPMKVSAQTAVEIPVTVFQAGAFIEGVKANRLRVSATPAVSAEMEVLAVAE